MSKKTKFLYEFTVSKEVEKKIEEKRVEEGGEEITITRTEKVQEPIKFCILRPTRKLYDSAEIFLAKTISEYIKEGIMPITLVAKRFGNDGGALTNDEVDYVSKLQVRLDEYQQKLINLKTEEKPKEVVEKTPEEEAKEKETAENDRTKLLVDMMGVQSEIDRLRNSYLSLYENTAEMKARKKTIEWWITQLSYHGGETPAEFFTQPSFAERYQKYVEIFDGDDDFLTKVITKFTFLVGTWFANSSNLVDEKDFAMADEHFEKNFQDE